MEQQQIQEINQHIKDGLKQWSDICLIADADNWSFYMDYDKTDVFSVSQLFMHVCSNIGIKKGRIDEESAEVYGNRIRDLVMSMTGFDTHHLVDEINK